jgi:hypothetical protein
MTAEDADQAATRFVDLYYAEGAIDLTDTDLDCRSVNSSGTVHSATKVTATTSVNTATVNATTAVNTAVGNIADMRATNCNATVGNITTAITTDTRATNVNATVGNITTAITTDTRATNVNATVGNITTAITTDTRATNVNATVGNITTAVIGTQATVQSVKHTATNVNGATVTIVNPILAGDFVIGVTATIDSNVAGATSINVGDGSDDDEFGVLSAVTAGTNFTWGALTPFVAAANTNVVLTAVGGGTDFDGNGNVSVFVTALRPTAL